MAKTTETGKAGQRPGENGFKYRPQFGLVINCKDESEQQKIYARLMKQGLKLKVVCV
ncbi:hypothetical protein LZ683_09485 [Comamonas testosteroni]|uniref:hypothetical protein n=1 Tax=Comamonas testosteroni TaxID=285 RepID=UPI0023AABB3D|nr:hypothetical protein [Comamonas testosteroni]WEE79563.1 hypothetical protein LZ683_09485 [Comamonas testosteroni]